jgi:septal ring factor EnvC (AmiA/AmiB activator)
MTLPLNYKVYAGLAAVVAACILAAYAWSNYKTSQLKRSVEEAKQNAERIENDSRSLEQRAAEYKQKIEYLEHSLSEIETIARKQDEKLKELANDTNAARDAASRARAVRSIESTTAELCAKLAELGHPCGD